MKIFSLKHKILFIVLVLSYGLVYAQEAKLKAFIYWDKWGDYEENIDTLTAYGFEGSTQTNYNLYDQISARSITPTFEALFNKHHDWYETSLKIYNAGEEIDYGTLVGFSFYRFPENQTVTSEMLTQEDGLLNHIDTLPIWGWGEGDHNAHIGKAADENRKWEDGYKYYFSFSYQIKENFFYSNNTNPTLWPPTEESNEALESTYAFGKFNNKITPNYYIVFVYLGTLDEILAKMRVAITAQTSASINTSDDGRTLNVTAAGEGLDNCTLTYQWYESATNSNSGGTPITGATTSSYVIPNNTTEGTHYYYCVVTATVGNGSASAISDVITAEVTTPNHIHSFSYSVSGATLTATCSEEGCELPSNSATLTVTSTQTVSTALAAFNTATGLSATAGDVLYEGNNTIPTTPGLYTQTVVITAEEGKSYTLTFPRKLLVLSEDADNSTALTDAAGETAVDVRILRTFKAGYNTLCLPFALTESEISSALSGATISKPSASSGTKAGNITKMTTEVATAISSGGVYIVHFASTPANWAIANTLFENKVITASVTPVSLTGTNTTVKATFSVLSAETMLTPGNKKQLFIKDGGNGFTYPKTGDDTKLKGFRAWFERE